MKGKRGFTLIEMVVVLAVVAILAAILVPTIEKNILDAKIARANNEVQVLGAAMASFYKDVGIWPMYSDATTPTQVDFIVSNSGTAGSDTNNYYWWGGSANGTDTFENQLISNTPNYTSCATTTSENCWKGPYIAEVKADPWGHKYSSNVKDATTNNAMWVWCAGPDGVADTNSTQPQNSAALSNDDIGVRIR